MALTELNGSCAQVLASAKKSLPKHALIDEALAQLEKLAAAIAALPGEVELSIDLSDLRGYQYHSGVMFAAYVDKLPQPIARGGRYDHVGEAFGRSRPATGFSMDLLTLSNLAPLAKRRSAILAPWIMDSDLASKVAELRSAGEVVIQAMNTDAIETAEYSLDRELAKQGDSWVVKNT